MVGQLSLDQLKQHAPSSRILAFRHAANGSPMQDWCGHIGHNPLHRRELEEFVVMGDVVLRIADELEPEPVERVKIMSVEYAVRVLGDEIDAREFIRCVKAIASPDAGQFEFEQIAAYYYAEIRRRGVAEVLYEMGMLGLNLEAVTSTIADREIGVEEVEIGEQKLTVADQRRVQAAAKNRKSLAMRTPNFDEELATVLKRLASQKTSRMQHDEYADFYLDEDGKSLDQLDQDFAAFAALEQYDENGLIGVTMNSGQRSVVEYDFGAEVDASYLPGGLEYLAGTIARLFVGYKIGGNESRQARALVASASVTGFAFEQFSQPMCSPSTCSNRPLSDSEFSEWLGLKLDEIYDRRTVRSVRRIRHSRSGSYEYIAAQEVNPDYDEMQYVATVCGILWNRQKGDFHLRSLRNRTYQDVYSAVRTAKDTADVAGLKKNAYSLFKVQNALSLKEFTALNTVAKSQESRLADIISPFTRKWLREIAAAGQSKLRFLKYNLYNNSDMKSLTRQEKQRLWDSVRVRETELTVETRAENQRLQGELFKIQNVQKAVVRVTPATEFGS